MKWVWFLHSGLLLIALSQCVKLCLIPINIFRDMFRTNLLLSKIGKGNKSINTGDIVMVLAFCTAPNTVYQYIKFHLFIFNTFKDMSTNLLLQNFGREITVITCDGVMVHALCTSADDILSMFKFYLIPFYTFRDMLRTN